MQDDHKANYLAFLLRLWREDEATPWRATLENPHNGERHSFSSLEKLYAFLEERTGDKVGDIREVVKGENTLRDSI